MMKTILILLTLTFSRAILEKWNGEDYEVVKTLEIRDTLKTSPGKIRFQGEDRKVIMSYDEENRVLLTGGVDLELRKDTLIWWKSGGERIIFRGLKGSHDNSGRLNRIRWASFRGN